MQTLTTGNRTKHNQLKPDCTKHAMLIGRKLSLPNKLNIQAMTLVKICGPRSTWRLYCMNSYTAHCMSTLCVTKHVRLSRGIKPFTNLIYLFTCLLTYLISPVGWTSNRCGYYRTAVSLVWHFEEAGLRAMAGGVLAFGTHAMLTVR